RASSIRVSGETVRRPFGQWLDGDAVRVGPSRKLDYELEIGAFIAAGNSLGERIAIDQAWNHIFGLCLLNDWSARDVQEWEGRPLGPFLSKNFLTTISPWIVTEAALRPFRRPASTRNADEAITAGYLLSEADNQFGALDISLTAEIRSETMRR